MAWTSTSEVITSAKLNETAPGVATAAGKLIVTDGANSVAERTPTPDSDLVNVASFTNTVYLSLANVSGGTSLPGEVSVTVTTGTNAIVFYRAYIENNTSHEETLLSFSVSTATTLGASDTRAVSHEGAAGSTTRVGSFTFLSALNAGTNLFTLQARVSAGTGEIRHAELFVIPL